MYLSIATVCIYLDLFPIGIIPFSLPYLCGREWPIEICPILSCGCDTWGVSSPAAATSPPGVALACRMDQGWKTSLLPRVCRVQQRAQLREEGECPTSERRTSQDKEGKVQLCPSLRHEGRCSALTLVVILAFVSCLGTECSPMIVYPHSQAPHCCEGSGTFEGRPDCAWQPGWWAVLNSTETRAICLALVLCSWVRTVSTVWEGLTAALGW